MQRALEGLDGVESVAMRFDDREFDVVHDAAATTAKMIEAVKAAGFESSTVPEQPAPQAR